MDDVRQPDGISESGGSDAEAPPPIEPPILDGLPSPVPVYGPNASRDRTRPGAVPPGAVPPGVVPPSAFPPPTGFPPPGPIQPNQAAPIAVPGQAPAFQPPPVQPPVASQSVTQQPVAPWAERPAPSSPPQPLASSGPTGAAYAPQPDPYRQPQQWGTPVPPAGPASVTPASAAPYPAGPPPGSWSQGPPQPPYSPPPAPGTSPIMPSPQQYGTSGLQPPQYVQPGGHYGYQPPAQPGYPGQPPLPSFVSPQQLGRQGGAGQGGPGRGGAGRSRGLGLGFAIASVAIGLGAAGAAFIQAPLINVLAGVLALAGILFGIIAVALKHPGRVLGAIGLGVSVLAVILCFTLAIVTVTHDSRPIAGQKSGSNDSSGGSSSSGGSASGGSSDSGDSGSSGSDDDVPFASVKPTDPNPVSIGSTGTYSDGLTVTVSAPTAVTPSKSQSGADYANNEVFEVTIVNGSTTSLKLEDVISATCAGTAGHRYFDSPDITLPRDPIAPGKSLSYKVGFSFKDSGGPYALDVAPAFKYDDMYFGAKITAP